MTTIKSKNHKRARRHARIRARVSGTAKRPRLAVFKSNRFIYAQLIDDEKNVTLATVKSVPHIPGLLASKTAGTLMAKKAKEQGISKVVFDRGGFSYLGIVKNFAEAARAGGLEF